jgi:hypothetical protein
VRFGTSRSDFLRFRYGPGLYERLKEAMKENNNLNINHNHIENQTIYRVAFITFEEDKIVDFYLENGVGEFTHEGTRWIYEREINRDVDNN